MRSIWKMMGATGLFAGLHSLLASREAKRAAARMVGERRQAAFYRPFYIGQSLLSFTLLAAYFLRLPSQTLYRISGPPARLMRLGQGMALLTAIYATWTVGIGRISGMSNVLSWWRGERIGPAPEAQGPEATSDGTLTTGGPFRWSRHPLNFSPIPIFWLAPTMTTRRLAFILPATLYLIVGSLHEEARLKDVYGERYEHYRSSGPPFFFPRP